MSLKQLIADQADWASRRWPGHQDPRAPSLGANLIVRMSRDVRCQFERGSGGELGTDEKPGKMYSLRSSSALSYNVFAPWIGHDLAQLARALGTSLVDQTLQFERQFPHGLQSTPPNIDVVLDNQQPRPLGIESKFTELYGTKRAHPPLDNKYFVGKQTRWSDLGLNRCQAVASNIGRTVQFHRLAAGQLLKHFLGLAWTTNAPPRLLYIYYDSGCMEAGEHQDELNRFRAMIDSSLDFSTLSYQELFSRLHSAPEPRRGYHSYLKHRYFAA